MQLEEEVHDYYNNFKLWHGPQGGETVVVDLWSGAVGYVDRDNSSEDSTTSGKEYVEGIIYLPELEAKMEQRYGWCSVPYWKQTAMEAGFGASSHQPVSLQSFLCHEEKQQWVKTNTAHCRPGVLDRTSQG